MIFNMLQILHFVSGRGVLKSLTVKASNRVEMAFRPKTRRCYQLLFRNFVGFCICSKIKLKKIVLQDIMAYLEYLIQNNVSANMLSNNISALKAHFVMSALNFSLWDHPSIRYFVKSVKINRPLCPVRRNIMSLETLKQLIQACRILPSYLTFRAIFLMAFFGFLRISNIAPHSYSQFDPSRHLTPADIIFKKSKMLVAIKWSKTMQTRDKIHIIVLPKLNHSILCPVRALKRALSVYKPQRDQPLFQVRTPLGFRVATESRVRKGLSRLNVKLGFDPHHFTFHAFRRSGATCAYNAHVPLQNIKSHGSWASECVWSYIQQNEDRSSEIAASFRRLINA